MEELKVVVFRVGREEYAIPITQVVSIERMQEETKLPHLPAHIRGVVEMRGAIIPLIDLREMLNEEKPQLSEETRIVVVSVKEQQVGLIVDAATNVLDISSDSIQSPKLSSHEEHALLTGVANLDNRLIILLDVQQLVQNAISLEVIREIKADFLRG